MAGYEVHLGDPGCGEVGQAAPRASRPRSTRPSVAGRLVRGGRVTPRWPGSTWSASVDDLSDVDLVVEAVVEELSVKKALFASLDEICKPGAILATTTSSLPVVECAMATSRPADVVGLHFFNPAPGDAAGRGGADDPHRARGRRDRAGRLHDARQDRRWSAPTGPASWSTRCSSRTSTTRSGCSRRPTPAADDIDNAMKQGCGYPMGPFELLDVVGLDVSLAIQRELYLEFREPGFSPAPLLEHLVTAGYLGRKVARGFRDYSRSDLGTGTIEGAAQEQPA